MFCGCFIICPYPIPDHTLFAPGPQFLYLSSTLSNGSNKQKKLMCFSAEASIASSIIISSIGMLTLKKATQPEHKLFAAIPLFFGIQQLLEGVLWLTLPLPELLFLQKFSSYTFLLTALVVWPILIPLAIRNLENEAKKRRILLPFLVGGIVLASYYLFCLVNYPINPKIVQHHILYQAAFPAFLVKPTFLLYLIVTIGPLYISSIRKAHLMGTLMFLSCIVTLIFYTQYLTSIWCYFAALISGIVYLIISDINKQPSIKQIPLNPNDRH